MNTPLPITGRCACGKIQFKCSALPLLMFQCHCRDCQRATGGMYAPNVWFNVSDIEISREPKAHEVVSDAGSVVHHDFCEDCGSPIGMRTSNSPHARGFRAATFDDIDWLEPAANIYMQNSPKWEHTNPELRVFEGQPPDEYIEKVTRTQ